MEIYDVLEELRFNKLESQIYLTLLEEGRMSAYQLAKKIDIVRTSIYNALEHMQEKGFVLLVPEKTAIYIAQAPEVLLHKIETKLQKSIQEAKKFFEEFQYPKRAEEVIHLRGEDNILECARHILRNAKNEVYINADFDLDCFQEEFEELIKRNVHVIVFSFYEISTGCKKVEVYTHKRPKKNQHMGTRLMIVENETISIIAQKQSKYSDWTAIMNNNLLMIRMLEEHIHNDIYLLNIRKLYGNDIYEKIQIHSQFENEAKEQAFLNE